MLRSTRPLGRSPGTALPGQFAARVCSGFAMPPPRNPTHGLDCQTCGACCCNTNVNRAENYPWYVEVQDDSTLLNRPDLVTRYVVRDHDGTPHMRLDDDGRCSALQGKLGRNVRCMVYAHRPKGCRRVQPGDEDCLRARKERGIDRE